MRRINLLIKKILVKSREKEREDDVADQFAMKLTNNKNNDYLQEYTAFTVAIHKKLDCPELVLPKMLLSKPLHSSQTYETENECMETSRKILENVYSQASVYFEQGHYQCIATLAATYYSKRITDCLKPLMKKIQRLTAFNNQWAIKDKINLYYNNTYPYFLKRFETLLQTEAFEWSPFCCHAIKILDAKYDYYDKKENMERPSRIKCPDFLKDAGMQKLPDFSEYIYTELDEIIQEMEESLHEILNLFCRAADKEYRMYIEALEMLIDKVVRTQMPYRQGEDLESYLERMCVLNGTLNMTVV